MRGGGGGGEGGGGGGVEYSPTAVQPAPDPGPALLPPVPAGHAQCA